MKNARSFLILSLLILVASGFHVSAQQPAPQPTPVAIKIAPEAFDPFVGQYEDPVNLGGTIFSFFREGEKFYLRITNQDKIEIAPLAPNKFFLMPAPRGDVEFVRDATGKVIGS